jgi:hypothetical protein
MVRGSLTSDLRPECMDLGYQNMPGPPRRYAAHPRCRSSPDSEGVLNEVLILGLRRSTDGRLAQAEVLFPSAYRARFAFSAGAFEWHLTQRSRTEE